MQPHDFQSALPEADDDELVNVIKAVEAMANHFAPCIASGNLDAGKAAVVDAIVRKAVIYEMQSRNGTVSTESAGPFSRTLDTTNVKSSLYFSPQQIAELRSLCTVTAGHGMYSIGLTTTDRPLLTTDTGWW